MNCFLIFSNSATGRQFVKDYIAEHKILNVLNITEKIGVDTVRDISKSLSLKLQNDEKRVIILDNEITMEAQNALLKSLEELSEQTDFFILARPHANILPTIISRCKTIKIDDVNTEIEEIDVDFGNIFSLIDKVEEQKVNNFEKLQLVIRGLRKKLLLEGLDAEKKNFYYKKIKGIYKLSPLVINNNVNIRIALEKVFLE